MSHVKQKGAVSIFIVMFTALMVTIVTTGFVQIMLQGQRQSSNNDLSQSAYDSALAGIEDAKRALVRLKECQRSNAADCAGLQNALTNMGNDCDVLGQGKAGVVAFNDGEVPVQGIAGVNQAYTCVKVDVATESVTGDLLPFDGSVVIPLDSIGDDDDIESVRISWFMQGDLPTPDTTPTFTSPFDLPSIDVAGENWPRSNPAILRSQLIQFSRGDIELDDFNTGNARTLFLYPTPVAEGSPASSRLDFASDTRRTDGAASRNSPSQADCAQQFEDSAYLCSVTIDLPAVSGGNREAYLQLAALYNQTSYVVELIGSSSRVLDFDGVQPRVDATGRASDLFRRVEARVSVRDSGSRAQFPNAGLIIDKSICKDFFVSDSAASYSADTDGIECDPRSRN